MSTTINNLFVYGNKVKILLLYILQFYNEFFSIIILTI